MPGFIKSYDNKNRPLVDENNGVMKRTYFNIVRLNQGEVYENTLNNFESVYSMMSGSCDIKTCGITFEKVSRKDIWSGYADSVYVPTGGSVTVKALCDGTEIAVAGGLCQEVYKPFRVTPEEVEVVDVGSNDTHSSRRICHMLGQKDEGRTGNLLVSECMPENGCWSGYPPHKHDTENGSEESDFEEIYHYRFNPENGFGMQLVYQSDGSYQAFMTKSGDTCLIDRGYHPTVASPGHSGYIFTILVGKCRHSLVQNFKEEYRHLMNKIPGINAMIDKFK